MPEYTFRCDSCDEHWNEILRMDDHDKPTKEPHSCGGGIVRVFTVPQIISDDLGLKGVVNPCDGKAYDSKAEYHRTLKANGCEVAEGRTKPKEYVPQGIKEDIAQAYRQHS